MVQDRSSDARAAALAARQHALVTLDQVIELGFGRQAVRHRLRTGRWVRVRPAVFAIAGVESFEEQAVLAAVLACGSTAAASHGTAARLWGLPQPRWEGAAWERRIEVTTCLERLPRLAGVWAHRSGRLEAADRTELRRIPVHTVERSIVDLSGRLDETSLAAIVDTALRRRLTTPGRLRRTHGRLLAAPGRSPARLSRVLDTRTPGLEQHESPLEDRTLEVIRAAGLPVPTPQHRVSVDGRTFRLDFAYVAERVAIECDGFDYHRTRGVFDDDRRRDNLLRVAGWTVLRFTSHHDDDHIVESVRAALGRCAHAAS